MTKTFDPTKPVQTRDGRPARILATDLKTAEYPIVAAITESTGKETIITATENGGFWGDNSESGSDLVNVPERKTLYFDTALGSPTPHVYLRRSDSKIVKVVLEDETVISSEIVTQ